MTTIFLALFLAASYNVEEKDTARHAFEGAKSIDIDTLNGSIEVRGHAGSDVRVTVERTIRAESAAKITEARRDVKLDISGQADLRLYVDGPFRCRDREHAWRDHHDPGYSVRYDFRVEVPRAILLRLASVNEGDIRVAGTSGDYRIAHVNGRVTLEDVEGSGAVRTVNGKVVATYVANPRGETSFKTINGAVDVSLRPGLAADLWMKTMNGEIYTDFDVQPLPSPASSPESRGAKTVWRSNRSFGVRVANGGPPLRFETLNGNIYIRSRGQ
jgi:DUF4097 and DUF4098 domain-containing protein YvlB